MCKFTGEFNVQRFYDTLAKLYGDKEGLNVKFTVTKRSDIDDENNNRN